MKPRSTFFVNVKLWLHSEMCIWASFSWSQSTSRVKVWGPFGTLAKQQGSHELIWGTKGSSIKAQVHRDRKVSNPIVNQSINKSIVFSSMPRSSKWHIFFGFPTYMPLPLPLPPLSFCNGRHAFLWSLNLFRVLCVCVCVCVCVCLFVLTDFYENLFTRSLFNANPQN